MTNIPKAYIEMVHFQLTKRCNLRCYFCGQWGNKGFFCDEMGEEMSMDNWKKVIEELCQMREESKVNPYIMLWGGEPLMSDNFEKIVHMLSENGFTMGMVTNGTLIDKYKEIIENNIETVYVSIDGVKEIHDSIRGEGVYDKVTENIKNLNHKKIIVMSVVTEQFEENLKRFISDLNKLGIYKLFLQDLIGLKKADAEEYKKWFKEVFSCEAKYIDSWINEDMYISNPDDIEKIIEDCDCNFGVDIIKHKEDASHCLSPFRHAHITWQGNVTYCTDFYDFFAGNVKQQSLKDIFYNKKSEQFRNEILNGNCKTCSICSWKNKKNYLDS